MVEGTKQIPEWVEVIADLGNGIIVARVEIENIREQDVNAQVMPPEMFRQLTENIGKRQALESLPFCALTDKVEMVSGHHRLRASKEAGLKSIIILLDISGLTRSQIVAKQIAHNAINGFSDKSTLMELAKMITDVDDMIESYIGKDLLKEQLETLDKLISPSMLCEWQEIGFMWLPHQIKDLEKLVSLAQSKAFLGASPIEEYNLFLETLMKYQKFSNIKNIGSAVHAMVETAIREMDEQGFSEEIEWKPISSITGSAAMPKQTIDTLKAAFKVMEETGQIEKGKAWQGLELLANKYLGK